MRKKPSIGERIAARAVELIGAPWWPDGRDPKTGIDCGGLVAISLESAGVTIYDDPLHRSTHKLGSIDMLPPIAEALRELDRLPPDVERLPGDVLVFRYKKAPTHKFGVCHMAVCETPDVAINTVDRVGVRRTPLDPNALSRLVAVWRSKEGN